MLQLEGDNIAYYSKVLYIENSLILVRFTYTIYSSLNPAENISTDSIPYLIQICEGLKQLHSQNVIHGNLNPTNILYHEKRDKILLCDYGINEIRTNRTKKCLNYTSPEELENKETSNETDIWNLGLIIYKFLIGDDLFESTVTSEEIKLCKYKLKENCNLCLKILLEMIIRANPKERLSLDRIEEILKSIYKTILF